MFLSQELIEKQQKILTDKGESQQLVNLYSEESKPPTNGTADGTNSNSSTWWGLDSTQILIIFLTVVFAVLIVFLLIYYYCIRGMRQTSVNRIQAQKSASGSIGEDRSRNIFAHPDKQLAVDQSTRNNPNSPASASATDVTPADQQQQQQQQANVPQPASLANLPGANSNHLPGAAQAADQTTPTPPSPPPSAANPESSKQQVAQKHADSSRQKSGSSGSKRNKAHDDSSRHSAGLRGSLTGLANTLRDTRG